MRQTVGGYETTPSSGAGSKSERWHLAAPGHDIVRDDQGISEAGIHEYASPTFDDAQGEE